MGVENAGAVAAHLGRWSPTDLAFVEEITFATPLDEESSLRITSLFQRREMERAWPDMGGAFLRVRLAFGGVRDFTVTGLSGPVQIAGFDITDIRDLGWEGIRWQVEDYEYGALRFYCRTAAVVDAEPVGRLSGLSSD